MKISFIGEAYTSPLMFQAALLGAELVEPDDADCIIVSGAGTGVEAEGLRKAGKRVLFGGKFAEVMVLRGDYHAAFLKKCGLAPAGECTTPHRLLVGCWYEDGLQPPYYCGVLRTTLTENGPNCGGVAAELASLTAESKAVEQWLKPVQAHLRPNQYAGLITAILSPATPPAVECIVFGVQPLIVEAVCEQMRGGLLALLWPSQVAAGGDVSVALQCSLPPWPYGVSAASQTEFTLDAGQMKRFWPLDVARDGDAYRTIGGVVGTVSARGRTFDEAAGRAAWTAKQLYINGLQWPKHVGQNTQELLACILDV